MSTVQVQLPPKLIPVFTGVADVRGSYGGRGSGKTRSFAKMTAVRAYMWSKAGREGIILGARQFMNSLDESSLEEIKAAISSEQFLADHFDVGEKYIRTKCGRISYKFSGLDRNINSIKSKARILLCWVDEAEPVTEEAWIKLIPTLREEDSELWVTWNPERKNSATHKRFREAKDDLMKVVEMNWRDNPWFPAILERKRQKDKRERPDQYDHIWEGDFVTAVAGAYFASHLGEAKRDGRIGKVARDPLLPLRAYWDIGGTGAKSDAKAIWIQQRVGREIRWLDYYESVGQELAHPVEWLRSNGYEKAVQVLPHDGAQLDRVQRVSYETGLRDAGFSVKVIENQGAGAAMKRVEAARRLFPAMWFDEKCAPGIEAIGWYHEKIDEDRQVGLGPEHDWSSHGADAFGLGCVDYSPPQTVSWDKPRPLKGIA